MIELGPADVRIERVWVPCLGRRRDDDAFKFDASIGWRLAGIGWTGVSIGRFSFMHPPPGAPDLARAPGPGRQKGLWLDVEVPTDEAALRIVCALHARRASGRWQDSPRGIWALYSPAGAPAYERTELPLFDASRRPVSEQVVHQYAEAVVQAVSIAWMRRYEWRDGDDRPPRLAGAAPAASDSGDDTFPEGAVIEALHRSRERNAALVAEAKRRAFARDGKLASVSAAPSSGARVIALA